MAVRRLAACMPVGRLRQGAVRVPAGRLQPGAVHALAGRLRRAAVRMLEGRPHPVAAGIRAVADSLPMAVVASRARDLDRIRQGLDLDLGLGLGLGLIRRPLRPRLTAGGMTRWAQPSPSV